MGKARKKNKNMAMPNMNISTVLLEPAGFNPHGLTVEETCYIEELIHVAKTMEQITAITYLYDKIVSLTDADEKKVYMDRFFRELENIKGKSDDKLRTSVVSKLTATELKQLFKI